MKTLVLKIGGSLLYNDELVFNTEIVKKVEAWYEKQKEYDLVLFVVGGGKISRFVVNQVKGDIKEEDFKHRIGMKMTQVNSAIFHGMLGNSDCKYFDSLKRLFKTVKKKKVRGAVIGGASVGGSTDMVAANIAFELGVDTVHKISNISNVYCSDPKTNENAQPIEKLSWEEYAKLFKEVFEHGHQPGMNIPVDFRCASFCKKNEISFRICGGENLKKMEIGEVLKTGTIVG